jgi:hypothetical protein
LILERRVGLILASPGGLKVRPQTPDGLEFLHPHGLKFSRPAIEDLGSGAEPQKRPTPGLLHPDGLNFSPSGD